MGHQSIAQLLLILRVAQGRAWDTDRVKDTRLTATGITLEFRREQTTQHSTNIDSRPTEDAAEDTRTSSLNATEAKHATLPNVSRGGHNGSPIV